MEGGVDGPLPGPRAHRSVLGTVSHATRHTRQRAVGSVSGSPWTRKKSAGPPSKMRPARSEEHTSELQSPYDLVCRLLLEKKKKNQKKTEKSKTATERTRSENM